jgi:RHS repeat-associated protein
MKAGMLKGPGRFMRAMLFGLGLLGLLPGMALADPPTVQITSPTANEVITLPFSTTQQIAATATPSTGATIVKVEIFLGTTLAGSDSSPSYSYRWALINPAVGSGTYSVSAKVTDSLGAVATSAAVPIIVNARPTVTLTSPSSNQTFAASTPITLAATAADSDGTISRVEFIQGATLIGTANVPPYGITWIPPGTGLYSLSARAIDNLGAYQTAVARVNVVVAGQPTVALTAPAVNSKYLLPAELVISASADDLGGSGVTQVQFFANGQAIGTSAATPYSITWSNPAPGNYTLTAIATNGAGAQTTSAARTVIISDTHLPPVVSNVTPSNNAIIIIPTSIEIRANVFRSEVNTPIALLEFLVDGQIIGTQAAIPTSNVYSIPWANPTLGIHTLTVRATDSLGATSSAASTVTIKANQAPSVVLTSPTANRVLVAPGNLTLLSATATDSLGWVEKVEFYSGATLIGTALSQPYTAAWTDIPPGIYSVTAKAIDNLGASTYSAPVTITVDAPPTVTLTSPSAGAVSIAPATISLAAIASDPDNNLAKVEFFQGTTLIATVLTPPYTATWSNVPQGSYQITAVATDAAGAQTTSAPITIAVTPAQANLYFIHPDHLGTPRLVTDESNTIVWRNLPTTEPFGNSPVEDDPSNTGNHFVMPLAFPGQYRDRESGLNYNFFRDYDSGGGRYVQSDPIGLRGGINTYTYVNGNPVSLVDPLGLEDKVSRESTAKMLGVPPDWEPRYLRWPSSMESVPPPRISCNNLLDSCGMEFTEAAVDAFIFYRMPGKATAANAAKSCFGAAQCAYNNCTRHDQ